MTITWGRVMASVAVREPQRISLRRTLSLLLAFAVGLVAVGCSSETAATKQARQELSAARDSWRDAEPDEYVVEVAGSTGELAFVCSFHVTGGDIVMIDGDEYELCPDDAPRTPGEGFDLIDDELSDVGDNGTSAITYDDRGVPASVRIEPDCADCQTGWTMSVTDGPPVVDKVLCGATLGAVWQATITQLRADCPEIAELPIAIPTVSSGALSTLSIVARETNGEVSIRADLGNEEASTISFSVWSVPATEQLCDDDAAQITLRGDDNACVTEGADGVGGGWSEDGQAWRFQASSSWSDSVADVVDIVERLIIV